MRRFLLVLSLIALAWSAAISQEAKKDEAITPEAVDLGRPVDFEKDVYPILDAKCLACHNTAIAENGLNLEGVKFILKGGKRGPAVTAKDPEKSVLFRMASRMMAPAMPPLPNKVEATALTPKELGIIKQWIVEGATEGMGMSSRSIEWHPLPEGINPIYAVAVTPDGQYVACGRANKITIYHVPTGDTVAELTDPSLLSIQHQGKPMYTPGSSHRDFVHSLAFTKDGRTLASGSFREVKLWTRPESLSRLNLAVAGGPTTAVAVSPDNSLVAVAAADNSIKLFNSADGQPTKSLAGHAAKVTGLQFSPDSKTLYSTSLDKSLRAWQAADGAPAGRIDAPAPLNGLALTLDGKKAIVAGADNLLHVFEAPAPAVQLAAPAAPVAAVRVSPDKKWLALAEADGKITLIDLATGQTAKSLAGHTGAATSLGFSGNSARLVSGGADKTVRVWDVASGQPVTVLSGSLDPVTAVALHPNGNQVVSASQNGQTTVWKLDVPEPRALAGDNGTAPTVSAVSNDGKQLATDGVADGKPVIFIRDIASGNVTKTLAGHEAAIASLAFSPDGQKLVSGSADKTARVWTLTDQKEVAKYAAHTNTVTAVAFNADATLVVSGAADNVLKAWKVADATEAANFAGHTGALVGVAVAANNQTVVSASADQTVRLWNLANGQQAGAITYGAAVTAVALSPDGQKIAAAGADNQVRLYQLDGKELFKLTAHAAAVKSLHFSTDNLRVVSAGADNVANVWDAATGTLVESTTVAAGLAAARFADTANTLVLGAADKSLKVHSLRFERPIVGHTMSVTGLAYNPGGDAVFTSSLDGQVRRFALANAQQQFAQAHGSPIYALAQSPDGNWLATGGENKLVRIWNAGNGAGGPKPEFAALTGAIRSLAFSLDNLSVAAGTADNQVIVYTVQTGTPVQAFAEHAGSVDSLAAAGETGKRFISCSADKTVKAWSLLAERQIAGHTGAVNSVALVLPQGTQVLSGSEDGTVRHWDLTNGNMVKQMAHGGPVTSVAARPDGQFYASVGANNIARLWNGGNGQQVVEWKGDTRALARVATLTADEAEAKGNLTAATTAVPVAEKAVVDLTAAATKAAEAKVAAEKVSTDAAAASKTAADAAAAAKKAADDKKDDQALAKAATDAAAAATTADAAAKKAEMDLKAAVNAQTQADKAVKDATAAVATAKSLVETTTQKQKAVEAALNEAKTQAAATEKPLRAVAFSPDGKELAIGGDLGTLATYDPTTGAPFGVFDAHGGAVHALAYGAGRTIVTAGADQAAKAWELNPPWTLSGVLGPKKEAPGDLNDSLFIDRVLCLDFNHDGSLLASGGGDPSRSGELLLWDVKTQALSKTFTDAHSDTVFGVEFSPDNTQLLSGAADKFVKIFDLATGNRVKSFEGHTNHVLDVSWKHDARLIASAGADNAIKIWSVDTGEQQRTIAGYAKQVTSLQFLGRGQTVLSCGGDKTVRFHQADNGNNFRNFGGATDFMFAAAGSDDEKIIISGGQDGVLRIWSGANAQPLKTFDPPKPTGNQQAAK